MGHMSARISLGPPLHALMMDSVLRVESVGLEALEPPLVTAVHLTAALKIECTLLGTEAKQILQAGGASLIMVAGVIVARRYGRVLNTWGVLTKKAAHHGRRH